MPLGRRDWPRSAIDETLRKEAVLARSGRARATRKEGPDREVALLKPVVAKGKVRRCHTLVTTWRTWGFVAAIP